MTLKSFLKNFKIHENSIKTVITTLLFVIAGLYTINYLINGKGETIPPLEIGDETKLPTLHIVNEGEDLWSISEDYYGSGYNWSDIAQENEITNPNIINAGQNLTIPDVAPKQILSDEPSSVAEDVGPTDSDAAETKVHKVVKGESLWKVSEKYYNTGFKWVEIAKSNNLENPNIINEDQELSIPGSVAKEDQDDKMETSKDAINSDKYTVEKGDSLWSIAVRAYGDGYKWLEIAKANNLLEPGLIHQGNELTLPRQ